jgi:hypothetical protein
MTPRQVTAESLWNLKHLKATEKLKLKQKKSLTLRKSRHMKMLPQRSTRTSLRKPLKRKQLRVPRDKEKGM